MSAGEVQAWCGGVPWTYRAAGQGPRGLLVLGEPRVAVAPLEYTRRVLAPRLPRVETVLAALDGLVELLGHERLTRVDVYGHGVGAALAHALVRRHPDRVDRLALSGFGLYGPVKARWVRWLDRWTQVLPPFAVRGRAPHELALLADLMRNRSVLHVDELERRPGRVLVVLDPGDRAFSRREQQALLDTYPGATATYASGQQLDRKLEYFFRVEPTLRLLPALGRPARTLTG